MQVDLDIAAHNATECADEIVNLTRVGATDGISDTNAVNADLVDGLVDREQVDEVGAEGVLGGEADFDTLGLDELNDLDGCLGDVGHVLAVREFAEERGCPDNDVDTVNTYDPVNTCPKTEIGCTYQFQLRFLRRPCGNECG